MRRTDSVEGLATALVTSLKRFRRGRPETVERWRKEYLNSPTVIAGLRRIRRVSANGNSNPEYRLVLVIAATANLLRQLRLLDSELNRQQFVRYAVGLGRLFFRQGKRETEAHAIRRAKVIARTAAELQLRITSRRVQSLAVQGLIAQTCTTVGRLANGMIQKQSPSAINVAIDGCLVWALGNSNTALPSMDTLNTYHNDVHTLLLQ